MKYIIKEKLSEKVSNQLLAKQTKIDKGTAKPDWKLSKNQRIEIKKKLFASQKHLCCYCECLIDNNHHIEHFYERHDFRDKIYNYDENMILSCQGEIVPLSRPENKTARKERHENIRCGHKKTKAYHRGNEIDYSLLLNPMQDNEKLFTYNSTGKIEPSNICNEQEKKKIKYTVKRMNLQSPRLTNNRIDTILLIEEQLNYLSEKEQIVFISGLLNKEQSDFPPFYSTIKDNFKYLIDNL